jgi:hypothetical protein
VHHCGSALAVTAMFWIILFHPETFKWEASLPAPRFLFLEGARSLRRVQAADVLFAWLEVQQTSQHRKALHSTDV